MALETRQARATTITSALAFAALFGLQIACLIRMRSPLLLDDAPFFFRYAENIAAGHGYRFNVEEPPVWGASAPLWPLLLALGLKLGLGAAQASLVWGWILTLAATGLFGRVLHRLGGSLGVLALVPLLAVNFLYSSYATSGLETSLAYFLLASASWAIVYEASGLVLGVVAGLCLVHKIDFAPVGLALLAGAVRWRRPVAARAWILAGAVALAWYGFALWHFGSVVPNSMLRKLHMTQRSAGASWFFAALFWRGGSALLLSLLPFGSFALRRHGYLLCVMLAAFVPQLVVYTLKPPPEPYEWYVAASVPAVAFLAACGLAWLVRGLPRARLLDPRVRAGLGAAALVLLAWLAAGLEGKRVYAMHRHLRSIEPLREDAGEWIDRNEPADARVYAGHGHVAYRSRRFVYDGSFLNRPYEDDVIAKYRPEVLVWVLFYPDEELPSLSDYRIAKVFSTPERERPAVYVMERIERPPAEPPLRKLLLAEIPREHREAASRYGDAASESGSEPDAPSPAMLGELQRALERIRARCDQPGSASPAKDWPSWFTRLEARVAADLARDREVAPLPR